mgnify:CR=1 FL=1
MKEYFQQINWVAQWRKYYSTEINKLLPNHCHNHYHLVEWNHGYQTTTTTQSLNQWNSANGIFVSFSPKNISLFINFSLNIFFSFRISMCECIHLVIQENKRQLSFDHYDHFFLVIAIINKKIIPCSFRLSCRFFFCFSWTDWIYLVSLIISYQWSISYYIIISQPIRNWNNQIDIF